MPKKLVFLFFLFIYKIVPAQLTYQTLYVDYDSAWTYKNFKNYSYSPQRFWRGGKGNARSCFAKPGLAKGTVVVTERGTAATENVHWLRINNNGNESVFIGSAKLF